MQAVRSTARLPTSRRVRRAADPQKGSVVYEPDFAQIARTILSDPFITYIARHGGTVPPGFIIKQLCLVWNARGDADLAALYPNLNVAEELAIKALDR